MTEETKPTHCKHYICELARKMENFGEFKKKVDEQLPEMPATRDIIPKLQEAAKEKVDPNSISKYADDKEEGVWMLAVGKDLIIDCENLEMALYFASKATEKTTHKAYIWLEKIKIARILEVSSRGEGKIDVAAIIKKDDIPSDSESEEESEDEKAAETIASISKKEPVIKLAKKRLEFVRQMVDFMKTEDLNEEDTEKLRILEADLEQTERLRDISDKIDFWIDMTKSQNKAEEPVTNNNSEATDDDTREAPTTPFE